MSAASGRVAVLAGHLQEGAAESPVLATQPVSAADSIIDGYSVILPETLTGNKWVVRRQVVCVGALCDTVLLCLLHPQRMSAGCTGFPASNDSGCSLTRTAAAPPPLPLPPLPPSPQVCAVAAPPGRHLPCAPRRRAHPVRQPREQHRAVCRRECSSQDFLTAAAVPPPPVVTATDSRCPPSPSLPAGMPACPALPFPADALPGSPRGGRQGRPGALRVADVCRGGGAAQRHRLGHAAPRYPARQHRGPLLRWVLRCHAACCLLPAACCLLPAACCACRRRGLPVRCVRAPTVRPSLPPPPHTHIQSTRLTGASSTRPATPTGASRCRCTTHWDRTPCSTFATTPSWRRWPAASRCCPRCSRRCRSARACACW